MTLPVEAAVAPFRRRCTTHFRTYSSGDWDVHSGYGILTHGQAANAFAPFSHVMDCLLAFSLPAAQEEYSAESYDLLHRNCCHFADELCLRLGLCPYVVLGQNSATRIWTAGFTPWFPLPGQPILGLPTIFDNSHQTELLIHFRSQAAAQMAASPGQAGSRWPKADPLACRFGALALLFRPAFG